LVKLCHINRSGPVFLRQCSLLTMTVIPFDVYQSYVKFDTSW